MNRECDNDSSTQQGIRRGVVLLCAVIVLAALFAVGVRQRGAERAVPTRVAESTDTPGPPAERSRPSPPPAPVARVQVPLPKPTPLARQLVQAVSRQDRSGVPLTPEEALEWRKSADALIQQGPASVSAIVEFLDKNTDVSFGAEGRALLGFDSARAALIDALLQIGGDAGVSATLQVLHHTGDPREIALLAQNLEILAPEQYRTEAVSAARNVLAKAGNGKLPGSDVAPLFEVFQHYGGADVVADLEQARRHWEYYSAMTLAQLPEGAGIPSLVQIVQANGEGTMTALELLAQLSGRYAEARSVLLEMARGNRISSLAWPYLVTALAGNEYYFRNSAFVDPQDRAHPDNVSIAHIKSSNETFYRAFSRGSLTAEELKQRIAFIEELQSVTADPDSLQTLQESMALLLTRQPMIAAVSP